MSMSTSTKKQTIVQLAPTVALCETNPHTFLTELEKLVRQGYTIDFNEMLTLIPGCHITTVRLPEATA